MMPRCRFSISQVIVRTIIAPGRVGLNRVAWDLRYSPLPLQQRAAKGVQALPGRYTARLIANGRSADQAFIVELDPSLKISPDHLKTQFEISSEIAKMQSGVAASLAGLIPSCVQTMSNLKEW
jgi:hypothetical protein